MMDLNIDVIMRTISEEAVLRKAANSAVDVLDEYSNGVFEHETDQSEVRITRTWLMLKVMQSKLQGVVFYRFIHMVAVRIKAFIPKYNDWVRIEFFLKYQDEEFIRMAYQGVLKREPDQNGLSHYLSMLRSGQWTKTDILGKLRYAKEGRMHRVNIKGLFWRYCAGLSFQIPAIGYLLRRTAVSFGFLNAENNDHVNKTDAPKKKDPTVNR